MPCNGCEHSRRNRASAIAALFAVAALGLAAVGGIWTGTALAEQNQPHRPAKAAASKALPKFVAPRGLGPKAAATKPGAPKLPPNATATGNAASHAAQPNNAIATGTVTAHGALPKQGATANAPTPNAAAPNNARALNNAAIGNRAALPGRGKVNPAGTNRGAAGLAAVSHRGGVQRTPAQQRQFETAHRQALLTQRNRLPVRPLPGERGFTGVPPAGETRFVTNEMVFHVPPNVSRETVDNVARRMGLSTVGAQTSSLTGGTLYRFNISNGRPTADVVRALEAENIGVAQPNYVFRTVQDTDKVDTGNQDGAASPDTSLSGAEKPDTTLAARSKAPDPSQYVVGKLHLGEVHQVATGSNVLVAVIDSQVDSKHPDLAGAIVEEFDAVGRADKPHVHGTGMTGAIAAHRRLMGIAPEARILSIHAFSPEAAESPQATTQHILAGLEWAIKRGARVINMSFAGPYDPMLQLAMKSARAKGIVLIAAAGNAGPKSPPLYPAADPNVIAVTATDANDKLFDMANRGPQVALAAPGVDILEPAPSGGYQLTTGTSVAAAHVSGVAALLIERNPGVDVDTVHEILTSSAKSLSPSGRDDQFGWGLVDPAQALLDLDAKIARDKIAVPAKLPVGRAGPISSR